MNKVKKFKKIIGDIVYLLTLASLIGMLILIIKTDIIKDCYMKVLNYTVESNLDKYIPSKDSRLKNLYYDIDISDVEKENIENTLNSLNKYFDDFKEQKLKIIISRCPTDITRTILFNNLGKFEANTVESASGVYYPDFNLMLLDIYDLDSVFQSTKGKLEDVSTMLKICNKSNSLVLLHELGHFFDDISEYKLHNSNELKNAYDNEKDIIFNEDEEYYKSSLSEYIAEVIARILMIELDKFSENQSLLDTNTYKILSDFLLNI